MYFGLFVNMDENVFVSRSQHLLQNRCDGDLLAKLKLAQQLSSLFQFVEPRSNKYMYKFMETISSIVIAREK